jgi:hypothetical protein
VKLPITEKIFDRIFLFLSQALFRICYAEGTTESGHRGKCRPADTPFGFRTTASRVGGAARRGDMRGICGIGCHAWSDLLLLAGAILRGLDALLLPAGAPLFRGFVPSLQVRHFSLCMFLSNVSNFDALPHSFHAAAVKARLISAIKL